MHTSRNSIINKQSVYLSVAALIIFLSSSCAVQMAQDSFEQNPQSTREKPNTNLIKCKSAAELENIKPSADGKISDLQRAVVQRDVKAVKKLLRQNVNVEEKDNYEATALFYAVSPLVREPEVKPLDSSRRRMRQREAQQEQQAQIEITGELLTRGANPNQKDIYGVTPLIRAAGFGYQSTHALKLLTLLVENKADVNARDERGFTPLMEAARNGNAATVKFLLDHNANPDLTNCGEQSALSIAESGKFADVVRLLEQQRLKRK